MEDIAEIALKHTVVRSDVKSDTTLEWLIELLNSHFVCMSNPFRQDSTGLLCYRTESRTAAKVADYEITQSVNVAVKFLLQCTVDLFYNHFHNTDFHYILLITFPIQCHCPLSHC